MTAYRGLVLHLRGVQRIRHGDVDRAYDDLEAAEAAYRAVRELPSAVRTARESVPVASDPRRRFLDAAVLLAKWAGAVSTADARPGPSGPASG